MNRPAGAEQAARLEPPAGAARPSTPAEAPSGASLTPERFRRFTSYALLILIGCTAGMLLYLARHHTVNWDEFYFLSHIYSYERGELSSALQTGYVHAFRWLPAIAGYEVEEILSARMAYFALALGSGGLLFVIARRFLSATAALFSVACFFSYSDVLVHVTSFRADGLAVFLFLAAVCLLLRARRTIALWVGAGVLFALCVLTTIKAIFYLFALVPLVVVTSRSSAPERPWLPYAASFFTSAAVAYLMLQWLHRLALPSAGMADVGDLGSIGTKVLMFGELFPRSGYLLRTISENAALWFFGVLGGSFLLADLWRGRQTLRAAVLLSLAAPLVSVAFYRNAFPYYYVSIVPPALLLCGVFFDWVLQRVSARRTLVSLALLVALITSSAWTGLDTFLAHANHSLTEQRRLVRAVHEIFPEPVPYIDRNSMIGSFPKVGFFMSTWGLERYHERGRPVFQELIEDEAPVLLLANAPALWLLPDDDVPEPREGYRLLKPDREILRRHYIPHWGPIRIAGRSLTVPPGEPVPFQILIPGTYTVEAPRPVRIDEGEYAPGDVISLATGEHHIESLTDAQDVVLRWGKHLLRPHAPPPDWPLYTGL